MWYLIVSIPDLCNLTYFYYEETIACFDIAEKIESVIDYNALNTVELSVFAEEKCIATFQPSIIAYTRFKRKHSSKKPERFMKRSLLALTLQRRCRGKMH